MINKVLLTIFFLLIIFSSFFININGEAPREKGIKVVIKDYINGTITFYCMETSSHYTDCFPAGAKITFY